MKKIFLVLTTAGLFAVSNVALSSDKALASAWTGVSVSIAKFAKLTNLRASATPAPATGVTAPQGERQSSKPVFTLPDFGAKEADGTACPFCPDPPCM